MPSSLTPTERTYTIALSLTKYVGPRSAIELIEALGSATALFTDAELRARIPSPPASAYSAAAGFAYFG